MSDDRLTHFHPGQLWRSPRGHLFSVNQVDMGGEAVLTRVLEHGRDFRTRMYKTKRGWDATENWVLVEDTETLKA